MLKLVSPTVYKASEVTITEDYTISNEYDDPYEDSDASMTFPMRFFYVDVLSNLGTPASSGFGLIRQASLD